MTLIVETRHTRALFVHIPKTGGIWVEQALKAAGLKWHYARLNQLADNRHALASMVAEQFDTSFAFTRNYRGWYRSWWSYLGLHRNGELDSYVANRDRWHPLRILGTSVEPLQPFLDRVAKVWPAFVTRMHEWYLGPPGAPALYYVGKMEQQPESLITALQVCGIHDFDEDAIRLTAKYNVSPPVDEEPDWRRIDELEAGMARWYRDET